MRALLLAALVALALPAAAAAQGSAPAAFLTLDDGALAYVPPGLRRGAPAPLLVLLHGHGGRPEDMLLSFRDAAERRGIVLLAPRSQGRTWDVIQQTADAARRGTALTRPEAPADPARILAVLDALAARIAIDPSRTGLAGFSDGASYALWLGTREPDRFRSLLLFSPGMALLPRGLRRGQEIFLAHGRHDPILPFSISARLAPRLRQSGLAVDFRRFGGGHELSGEMVAEGIDWFAARPG